LQDLTLQSFFDPANPLPDLSVAQPRMSLRQVTCHLPWFLKQVKYVPAPYSDLVQKDQSGPDDIL